MTMSVKAQFLFEQVNFQHQDVFLCIDAKCKVIINLQNCLISYLFMNIKKLQKIMQLWIGFLLFVSCTFSLQPCEPFGLRVYYGDIIADPQSTEKVAVYFNTQATCPDSFINVISSAGFKKVLCMNKAVDTSSFMNEYTANIHSCSLLSVPFDEGFSYIAYGWDQQQSNNPTPHKNSWVDLELIDPTPKDRTVRVVALADWGNIENNIGYMTPILDDLKTVIQDKQINALMIAGDIAYDLDSNYGDVYETFLQLLEEFSATLPIFHTPGNHQRRTVDAALLFNTTFKIYGLQENLAAGLSFGSLFILPFDPYNPVYNKTQDVSSLAALQAQLANGVTSGRFIVPFSHYPLICSGEVAQCQMQLTRMKDFFGSMLDSGVSLYVGAHTHSYERIYPYQKDGNFSTAQSPYQSDGGYLVSVVQGVAGSDTTIVETMSQAQPYTAAYTVNETGFGVIESTQQQVTYSHYSTKQGYMDEIVITIAQPAQKKKMNLNIEAYSS